MRTRLQAPRLFKLGRSDFGGNVSSFGMLAHLGLLPIKVQMNGLQPRDSGQELWELKRLRVRKVK